MAIVVNNSAFDTVHDYVVLSERNNKTPFTVQIKLIKSKDLAKLDDGLTQIHTDQSVTLCSGTYNFNILKKGIVGWKNLVDESGNEVPLIKNVDGTVKDESLTLLPLYIINEIADIIATISRNPDSVDVLLEKEKPAKGK